MHSQSSYLSYENGVTSNFIDMNKKIGELIKNHGQKFSELYLKNNSAEETKVHVNQKEDLVEREQYRIEFKKETDFQDETMDFTHPRDNERLLDINSPNYPNYGNISNDACYSSIDTIENSHMKGRQSETKPENKSSLLNKKTNNAVSSKNNIKRIEQEDEDYFYSSKKKPRHENNVNLIFKSKWIQAHTPNAMTSSDGIYVKFSNENTSEIFKKKSITDEKFNTMIKQQPVLKSDDEVSLDSDIEIPDF